MKLTEISAEKTPELFHTRYDGEKWLENEQIPMPDGIRLRRKAKVGWQDMWISAADWSLHLVHVWLDENQVEQEEEVATGQIFMEYLDWDLNAWTINHFETIDISLDGQDHIIVSLADSATGATLTIEQEWKVGSAKQTYRGNYPGQKIRVQCIVKLINSDKPVIDYSDFNLELVGDEVRNIAGVDFRYLIFASDGVDNFIEVDPYITLEETGTEWNVTCDGYKISVHDSSWSQHVASITQNGTGIFGIRNTYIIGGTNYRASYDSNRQISVEENSPVRVIIKVVAVPYSSRDSGVNTGLGAVEFLFYIYQDRFIVENNIIGTSTPAALDDNNASNYSISLWAEAAATNLDDIKESNNTEIAFSNGQFSTGDYAVAMCDEMNICFAIIYSSGNNTARVYDNYNRFHASFAGQTLNVGNNIISVLFIVDSTERENGSKLYTSTERLEMGNQYQDTALALTSGSSVTTIPGLTAIGTDGFQSDGAWHLEMT